MGHWNSRHRHLDRSLHNLLDYSLPHLPLLLQRFKPVQATHYSDSKVLLWQNGFTKTSPSEKKCQQSRVNRLVSYAPARPLQFSHQISDYHFSRLIGSSTSSALSLTEPLAYLGNHHSCYYSHSWNGGCLLATAGFFTPAKQALGTTHCSDHSAWSEWYHSPSLSKGAQNHH